MNTKIKADAIRKVLKNLIIPGVGEMRPPSNDDEVLKVGKMGFTKIALSEGNEIEIPVFIVGIKQSYGKVRYLLAPSEGSGTFWSESVNLDTSQMQDASIIYYVVQAIMEIHSSTTQSVE